MFTSSITSAQQALQLMTMSVTASKPSHGIGRTSTLHSALEAPKTFKAVSIPALNAILSLKDRPSISPEEQAMARVKNWVKEGLFDDAANGRDDLALRQAAREGKLDDLPALSAEQEKQLSAAELRVYSQAGFVKIHYDLQPRTLAQVKTDYVKARLSGLPEGIARITSALASGELEDVEGGWTAVLSDMKRELAAVKSGKFDIEMLDESLYKLTGSFETVRDGSGLVIGNTMPDMIVDWSEIRKRFTGKFTSFGHSEYFGAYVISWK